MNLPCQVRVNDTLKEFSYVKNKDRINKILQKIQNDQSFVKITVKCLYKITTKPWEITLNYLLPKRNPKTNEHPNILLQFFLPLILIWNLCSFELVILNQIMSRLNVNPSFLGLTIMSWGNNAPDMFNVASAMIRGMVDLALNATIASEIHCLLLGLGLPWLVYNLINGKPLNINTNKHLSVSIIFLIFFSILFAIVLKINNKKFDLKFGLILMVCYFMYLVVLFVLSFNIVF